MIALDFYRETGARRRCGGLLHHEAGELVPLAAPPFIATLPSAPVVADRFVVEPLARVIVAVGTVGALQSRFEDIEQRLGS